MATRGKYKLFYVSCTHFTPGGLSPLPWNVHVSWCSFRHGYSNKRIMEAFSVFNWTLLEWHINPAAEMPFSMYTVIETFPISPSMSWCTGDWDCLCLANLDRLYVCLLLTRHYCASYCHINSFFICFLTNNSMLLWFTLFHFSGS